MEVKYLQTEDEGTGIGNIRIQDKKDRPAQNTQSCVRTRNLMKEMVLSTLEIFGTKTSAREAEPRKYT